MSTDNRWPLPFGGAEDFGFSSDRLARIRPAMQKFVDLKKVPNIVTLIAREGKIVHFEALGYLDVENKIPVTKDAIFRLYSNSKPIAGLAVMILNEEGLLNLDDPVSKYIPAFKNPVVLASGAIDRMQPGPPSMIRTVPARREITIRDCLRNTTGLATPQRSPAAFLTQFRELVEKSGWDLSASLNLPPQTNFRQRVEAHARLPLSYEPGTDFDYHVGYLAIGVMIEGITGQTLEEFYQKRIFQPLGMKDTSFYLRENQLERFPVCYQPKFTEHEWCIAVFDRPETSEKVKGPKVDFAAGWRYGWGSLHCRRLWSICPNASQRG